MTSPLADIGTAFEVVFAPRPFSLDGLSQARIAIPVPGYSALLVLDARGSSALTQITPGTRLRWNPAEGYVMGIAGRLEWTSIRGFDDAVSFVLDAHAGMSVAEWTISTGIDALAEVGIVRGPTFRVGLAATLDSHVVTADLRLPWNRPAGVRFAGRFRLTGNMHVRVGVLSDPVSIECAVRTEISPGTQLLVDVRSAEPLGIRTTLTLSFELR